MYSPWYVFQYAYKAIPWVTELLTASRDGGAYFEIQHCYAISREGIALKKHPELQNSLIEAWVT